MKKDLDPNKLKQLETRLANLSGSTLNREFLSWEELSKKESKFPDLYTPPKTAQVIAFPGKFKWALGVGGTTLLAAAASLSFVFFLKKSSSGADIPSEIAKGSAAAPPVFFSELLGEIQTSKGNNFLLHPGETVQIALKKGDKIRPGDRILTADNGSVDLDFENKTWIRVASASLVQLTDLKKSDFSAIQTIGIEKGKVLATVGKLKKDSVFQIVSGSYSTIVRGTTFSVSVDEGGKQTVSVREGSVEIKNNRQDSEEKSIYLESSKQVSVSSDKAEPVISLGPKEEKELKALHTQVDLARENKLYVEYSRLELIRLEDGTELHGVILGQSDTHLQFEGADGKIEIPIVKIVETEKIR
ncbi:FecR family protein [Leptospira ilyithenensis]|uniref:Iron dicitrate transport regulator FecR n=1 Tax=Leptospira ilyithenensis TaxID=2484901 RepID=A0A4R9LV42_9LEPT|nr:FecR domain-containing protein [Leptospira ilyithenensis]TGN14674.1 iron dicitrate transport regulator FecR [Leptospira ilyithenensis]